MRERRVHWSKQIISWILVVMMIVSGLTVIPSTPVSAVTAGQLKENTEYFIVSKNSGKALTVENNSLDNNARICQMPIGNYDAQIWTLDYDNKGYYYIVNKSSRRALNVPWASTEIGVEIIQFDKGNGDNEKWQITDVADGYCRITPKMVPEFGLNVSGGTAEDGAVLIQWNYSGADNELWEFREVNPTAGGNAGNTGNTGNIGNEESQGAMSWTAKSLDANTTITVNKSEAGELTYNAKQGGTTVVESSPLGIVTSIGDFNSGLIFKEERINNINETYTMFSGKKSTYTNKCQEKELVFAKGGVDFILVIRAYDDGVAFRYRIETGDNRAIIINKDNERTGITLPSSSQVWYMPHENDYMFERDFLTSAVNNIARGTKSSMPMLYKTGAKYALVAEADKHGNYVGSVLEVENNRLFRTKFDPQAGNVTTQAPFSSPWRSIVIGEIDTIVSNTMVENLSPAQKEEYDFEDWVEPGISAWSWVSYDGAQDNPSVHKKFIELAANMGWKYYILDEKWQPASRTSGSNYEGMWDWFDDIKAYADEKGVKLIAWVHKNDVDTVAEREARFKEWSSLGIAGIKVDFFYKETQEMLQLHDSIYADAAKYRLLVNVHGSNPPSGEIRTYPNVIAREAIKGQEQGGITAAQYTILPFTRGAVGTADVTEQLYSRDTTKTTMGFQIALSTLIENGIRTMGGRPEDYYGNTSAVDYYKNFPEKWDSTKLISADVGQYVDIARKSKESWYAAGISVNARTANWKPDFLDSNKTYTAFIYTEASGRRDALQTRVQRGVTKDISLSFQVQQGGGYAVKFVPETRVELGSLEAFPASLKVQEYYTKDVVLKYNPEDKNRVDIIWAVENPDIAKVIPTGNGARIKGLKEGKTKVTATSAALESIKTTIEVEVTKGEYSLDTDIWTVLNDDAEYVVTGPNSVKITAQNGVIDKNVFAMKVPNGNHNFEITAKISGGMFANYQGGFIGVFNPNSLASNYVSVGRRYHQYVNTGSLNNLAMMTGQSENYIKDTNSGQPVYVRLKKEGSNFTSYYRFSESNAWTQIGGTQTKNNLSNSNDIRIGFYAGAGGTYSNIDVIFEDFKYNGNPVSIGKFNTDVEEESFTVGFDSAGGTTVETQILQANKTVMKPTDPIRNGYIFQGWYLGNELYDFSAIVKKDLYLVAKWKANEVFNGFSIEAEAADLSTKAVRVASVSCSNGYYIADLGGPGINGTATFYVNAETAGLHTMKIYYCTGDDRRLNVLVNGTVATTAECPNTGGWDVLCAKPITLDVDLVKGDNIIRLTGANGTYAPNVDRIEIELTDAEAKHTVEAMVANLPADVTSDDVVWVYAIKQAYDNLNDKLGFIGLNKLNTAIDKVNNPDAGEERVFSLFSIEAETARLEGAVIKEAEAMSNGAYVGAIGDLGEKATLQVYVEEPGRRKLEIYYATLQSRYLDIAVNGGTPTTMIATNSGGVEKPGIKPLTITIDLKAGINTIEFSGASAEAPNIDRIQIELTATEAVETVEAMINQLPDVSIAGLGTNKLVVQAVKLSYDALENKELVMNTTRLNEALEAPEIPEDSGTGEQNAILSIEAEDGKRSGGVRKLAESVASNGYLVQGVGGSSGGTIRFKVIANKAGIHDLSVYYASRDVRQLKVVVGVTEYVVSCAATGGWTALCEKPGTVKVRLQEGENIIQLMGINGADAPNIDKIALNMANAGELAFVNENPEFIAFPIESEIFTLSGASYIEAEEASNGYLVGNLGGSAGGTAIFTVEAKDASSRALDIYYTAKEKSPLTIAVNGGDAIQVICEGSGSEEIPNATPVFAEVELKAGTNTIVFGGINSAEAPAIDCLKIEMTESETQEIVQKMIDDLPEVSAITLDDAMKINAVEISYNALIDKTQVKDDKLTEALDRLEAIREDNMNSGNDSSEYVDFSLEGEVAALDGAALIGVEGASNGYQIGNLGGGSNGTAVFTISAERAGTRTLKVYYATAQKRILNIKVNENMPIEVACARNGNGKNTGTVPITVEIEVAAGMNKIEFSGVKGEAAPNIDRIELELTEREAQTTVQAMIWQLPSASELTIEDEKVVNAVKMAYEALTNKEQIENSKLNLALNKIKEIKNPPNNSVSNGGEQNSGNQNPPQNNNQQVKIQKITLTGISQNIAAGKTFDLTARVEPVEAGTSTITWQVSNPSYASVDANGRVSLKKTGKNKSVTIIAKANDGSGVRASYKIKVMPDAVKKISIKASSKSVKAGKKIHLQADIKPNLSSKKVNKKLMWFSSNTKFATVTTKGIVKTTAAGKGKKVKITAMATDGSGKKKSITIRIK